MLREAPSDLSASECAALAGLSRISARRYLEFFAETGRVKVRLRYGAAGRPERRYRWRTSWPPSSGPRTVAYKRAEGGRTVERVDGGMQRASGPSSSTASCASASWICGWSRAPACTRPSWRPSCGEQDPLREALRMLLAEDLVEQLPTGGMLVRRLDLQDMRELYAVRAALEGLAAREACRRLTGADLEALGGWSSGCGCWSTTRPS